MPQLGAMLYRKAGLSRLILTRLPDDVELEGAACKGALSDAGMVHSLATRTNPQFLLHRTRSYCFDRRRRRLQTTGLCGRQLIARALRRSIGWCRRRLGRLGSGAGVLLCNNSLEASASNLSAPHG